MPNIITVWKYQYNIFWVLGCESSKIEWTESTTTDEKHFLPKKTAPDFPPSFSRIWRWRLVLVKLDPTGGSRSGGRFSGFAADRTVRQAGAGSPKQELPRKRRRTLPSQVFAADQRQAGKTVKISSSYKPANYQCLCSLFVFMVGCKAENNWGNCIKNVKWRQDWCIIKHHGRRNILMFALSQNRGRCHADATCLAAVLLITLLFPPQVFDALE